MKTLDSSESSVASKIHRVTKTSISDEIATQIIGLISRGELQPGQRLPSERELCEHFGASRSSLREALRCLSIVGVLNAQVRNGTSVAPDGGKFLRKIVEWRLITERHNVEDLMEVRIALEGVSAANAALRATHEDKKIFRRLLNEMKESAGDAKRFAVLDVDFHIALANSSGNSLVFDLVSMIRGHLVRVLPKVLQLPNALSLSRREHVAIVQAIERGDAEGARAAMQAHLEAVLRRFRNAYKVNAGLAADAKRKFPASARRRNSRPTMPAVRRLDRRR
jgi:GntR family transcriptional regulator, transcriptional repressor for pyruvate dehydrogenase complex